MAMWEFLLAVAVQLIITITLGLFMIWLLEIDNGYLRAMAVVGGAAIWSMILFTTPFYKEFFIWVEPNHKLVLSSSFSGSKREIGEGWNAMWLWETAVKKPIDIGKKTIVKGQVTAPAQNDVLLIVSYQATWVPYPGHLEEFVKIMDNQDLITDKIKGRCEGYLTGIIPNKTEEELKKIDKTTGKAEIQKEFFNAFNGQNDDELELELGIKLDETALIITAIERPKEYQETIEGEKSADRLANIIKKLKDAAGEGVDSAVIFNAALALASKESAGQVMVTGGDGGKGGKKAAGIAKATSGK